MVKKVENKKNKSNKKINKEKKINNNKQKLTKETEKKSNKKINKGKKIDNNKQKLTKEIKEKSNKKIFFLIIPIVVIILIIGFLWFSLGSEIIEAQLVIESGNVQVKHEGGGWFSAENGMILYESDSVRTRDNSSASIIFFKTSIVRLDSNTEVTLKELFREAETSITIHQSSGRTWNTVSKISGINNYEVQTPSTVASVRGTAFVVVVWENGSSYYGVSHGVVNVTSISNGVIQDSVNASGNESVYVFIDLINESLEIVPFEIDEWMLENLLLDEQFIMDFKAELYTRIEEYIPEIKAEYGINDEEIDALLEGYILGYFDLPEDSPEWIKELFEFH